MMELDGHGDPTGRKLGLFENKTICVFGGTGTIGSLIVEVLLKEKPSVIRIFSKSEYNQWKKQQKWGFNNEKLRFIIGDIQNYDLVKRALKGVHYVFNCAALKHVPKCEYNPIEAVVTNILGLDNIINASIEQGVQKILHISTDKAVEPTTLMGATKMISERVLQIRWAQNPEVDMVLVRLGNVYGSSGSVIAKVREQKENGKNITITDRDMERFFMHPKEVIEFIMDAFKNGHEGDIWVPQLKEQKLMDVIVSEVGKRCNISIIGRRKGEKLKEKLLSDYERAIATFNGDKWVIKNTNWELI